MRSKAAQRILDQTPPEVREQVKKWAEDIVAGRAESPFVSIKPEQE